LSNNNQRHLANDAEMDIALALVRTRKHAPLTAAVAAAAQPNETHYLAKTMSCCCSS
jgi:hypothetical protein